jgi:hypothetical protein
VSSAAISSAVRQRLVCQRGALGGGAVGAQPLPRRQRGEHVCPDASLRHAAVGAQAGQTPGIARSEPGRRELGRLELHAQIGQLGRELARRAHGDCGRLLLRAHEHQSRAQHGRRDGARLVVVERLVGQGQVLGRGRAARERLRRSQLEQEPAAVRLRRQLVQRSP